MVYQSWPPPPIKKLELTERYSSNKYPRYDYFNAIEAGKIKLIPCDYESLIAVPVTFLDSWNHEQFELFGLLAHGTDGTFDFAKPILKEKEKYRRLLILRK